MTTAPGFVLSAETVVPYLVERGLLADGDGAAVEELGGGVSGMVLAVRAPGAARRREAGAAAAAGRGRLALEARAHRDRGGRAAALRPAHARPRAGGARPGSGGARRRDGAAAGRRAELAGRDRARPRRTSTRANGPARRSGSGTRATAGDPAVAAEFADHEPFEQLRLNPFYEVVAERLPEAAPLVLPRLAELRERRCLVDGDYAMKNMLIAPGRRWKLDFEVAHYGNPVFDIGFFLSFAVLSAIRWPALSGEMRAIADAFLARYEEVAGERAARRRRRS